MLEVKINLIPLGRESDKKNIKTIFIVNKGLGVGKGKFTEYYVCEKDPRLNKRASKNNKRFTFFHQRQEGAYECVRLALNAIQGAFEAPSEKEV